MQTSDCSVSYLALTAPNILTTIRPGISWIRKRTDSVWYTSGCVGSRFSKLLLHLAAAFAVSLRFLLRAGAAVFRCRCCLSSYLQLLRCWLAAFTARLGEMVVLSSRVFNVLYLLLGVGSVVFGFTRSCREQQAQHAAVFRSVIFEYNRCTPSIMNTRPLIGEWHGIIKNMYITCDIMRNVTAGPEHWQHNSDIWIY